MKKQTTALFICLLCLIFALSSLSSMHLFTHGLTHVCTGADCQICSLIEVVEKTMELSALVTLAIFVINTSLHSAIVGADSSAYAARQTTPITLKVKLSD